MKSFLIDKREALGLDIREMAKRCECAQKLLKDLEELDYEITHPGIAAKIALHYGLTLDEYNQLVHESRRANSIPKPRKLVCPNIDALRRGGWGIWSDE